jgi:hypothetical protein
MLNYFGTFFGLVPVNSDGLFAAVHLPLNSGGGLFFSDGWISPSQLVLMLSWDKKK